METITIKTELVTETCISCGIQFAVPPEYVRHLRETHRTFYCPNGHNMYYPAQTEEERLRKQLLRADREIGDLREAKYQAEKQLNGALGQITKLKKRANAGLCPYCRRHFANVERHIHNQHKDKVSNKQ